MCKNTDKINHQNNNKQKYEFGKRDKILFIPLLTQNEHGDYIIDNVISCSILVKNHEEWLFPLPIIKCPML